MGGGLGKCEVIARWADLDEIARTNFIVHPNRTAAACAIALHRNHIAVPLRLRIQQRIAPYHTGRQVQIDMGAGGKWRQFARPNRSQVDRQDARRLPGHRFDSHFEWLVFHRHE